MHSPSGVPATGGSMNTSCTSPGGENVTATRVVPFHPPSRVQPAARSAALASLDRAAARSNDGGNVDGSLSSVHEPTVAGTSPGCGDPLGGAAGAGAPGTMVWSGLSVRLVRNSAPTPITSR